MKEPLTVDTARSGITSDRVEKASQPRRILLTAGSYNHITDGVTLTLNRLVAFLEAAGNRVMILAPTTDDPELDPEGEFYPVPSVPIPGRGEYRFGLYVPRALKRRVEEFDPEIIHVATPDRIGRWALTFGRERGLPVVATFHTDFTSYFEYYHISLFEPIAVGFMRRFYADCDLVCVPSSSMIQELKARQIPGPFRTWARGVDTRIFNPSHRSVAWRRDRGFADGLPVITYVGRLVIEKNVEMLADISDGLRERGVPFGMQIVGEGPAREMLQERIPDAHFTGHLEGEPLSVAFASGDIFVFPSTTETFGNVVLEAMASGLPSVCLSATGSRDLVVEGVTGFLADPANLDELISSVETLAVDDELRTSMGRNALDRAQEYRWEAIMGRMLDYYDEATEMNRIRLNGVRSS